jgi:adenosyl cobinamide kinase/adenosyl cobinamide phosphate guanylyltransferase
MNLNPSLNHLDCNQNTYNYLLIYVRSLDNEEDIEIATERLTKDNQWSRLHALSALRSIYQSERRKEEAVIIDRLIEREKSKAKIEPDTGFHDDM